MSMKEKDKIDRYSGVFLTEGLQLKEAKKRYKKRRQDILQQLKEPALIFAMQTPIAGDNYWLMTHNALYQDPFFLYLTGINQQHTVLYLDPKTKEEVLFLKRKNPKQEFWEGPLFGSGDKQSEKDIKQLTGFQRLEPIDQLSAFIQKQAVRSKIKLSYFLSEPKKEKQKKIKDNTYYAKQKLDKQLKRKHIEVTWVNHKDLEFRHRLCLDKQDIKNLKIANHKTGLVFKSVLKEIKSYQNETQVAGHIKGEIIKQSAFGESFPAIVANEKNASILHYHKNNSALKRESLILLDFGVREYQVPADVSRTIPIEGVFNPLQRCLYSIVLDTQKKVEKEVKAGMTIKTLNTQCWERLEDLLKTRFLKRGGQLKRSYSKQPHHVSHLMAQCVHDGDPFRNYQDMPLEPGMVISNEPGLYGYFEWEIEGVLYQQNIGIRIEDNLLVTKRGCENLSKSIPKTIVNIEKLMH